MVQGRGGGKREGKTEEEKEGEGEEKEERNPEAQCGPHHSGKVLDSHWTQENISVVLTCF